MQKRYLLTCYRIFFGFLGFSAIVTEIVALIERGKFIPFNFFSFFTIESNLFAVFILILSAFALTQGKQSKLIAMLRGANTLNMILVGIVFTLLLSGLRDIEFMAVHWDNIVLHYIMPIVVTLDWFIDIPKLRIAFKQTSPWIIFPIAYVVYSLIRGYFIGWYPYPFLNPNNHGYIGVATTSVVLILGAVGLAWVLARFPMQNTTSDRNG